MKEAIRGIRGHPRPSAHLLEQHRGKALPTDPMCLRRNLRHARLRSRRGSHCEPGAQLLEQRLVRNRRIGLADLGTAPVVHDRPLRRQSVAISGSQWQSVAISGNQRGTPWDSSALISTHQHSAALRGTQRHSEALRGTQRHSVVLSGACAPASLAARGIQPAATQANTRGERGAERASRELRGCGMVHAMRMNSAPEAIKRLWNGACNEVE